MYANGGLERSVSRGFIENNENGEYASKFKRSFREEFSEGQSVRIARRKNLGTKAKTDKGRFVGLENIVA